MSRYTEAYKGFIIRLKEIECLLKLAPKYSSPLDKQATIQVNALCRSGVVLLSSHIEGYIEDLGEIALDRIVLDNLDKTRFAKRFKFYLSRDLINEIKRTENPEKAAPKVERLFERDGHIWDDQPRFLKPISTKAFIDDFSNPTHKRIKEFFNRFGYNNYQHDLATHLKAQLLTCNNMIDQVIDQRNKIAHGDQITTSTLKDLSEMLFYTKLYCRSVDIIVANWFRGLGCCIR